MVDALITFHEEFDIFLSAIHVKKVATRYKTFTFFSKI